MKYLINTFIKSYCTPVLNGESDSQVELMMDNHKCIHWEGQQYYIPEENSCWNEDEELIYQFLTECFHI